MSCQSTDPSLSNPFRLAPTTDDAGQRGLGLFTFALWLGLSTSFGTAYALPIDLAVTIQPIQVRTDEGTTGATVGFFEAETDQIWRQAGIDIQFLRATILDDTDFLVLEDTTEVISLFLGADHGQHSNPLILNMWFVEEILPPVTTFGIAFVGANGMAIGGAVYSFNGGMRRLDTLAHEIGHNLGLEHSEDADPLNLMTAGRARTIPRSIDDISPNGIQTDQLTEDQIRVARESDFAKAEPVPEPGTLHLFIVGLIAFILRRLQTCRAAQTRPRRRCWQANTSGNGYHNGIEFSHEPAANREAFC
jgi:hypothetical protein